MTKNRLHPMAVMIFLALLVAPAIPQPCGGAAASDWGFIEDDGGDDWGGGDGGEWRDEGGNGGETALEGDWNGWNDPPRPGDEGDDFNQAAPPPTERRDFSPDREILVDSRSYKATWLDDPMFNIPFAQVVTPGDWVVWGRPKWNALIPVKPWSACIVLEIPRLGASALMIGPYHELMRRVGRGGNMIVALPEGTIDTDTGTLVQGYRDADAVLRDFIEPGLRQHMPGFRAAAPRAISGKNAGVLQRGAQAKAQLGSSFGQVTGIHASEAEMRFEFVAEGGRPMEGMAITSTYGASFATSFTTVTFWTIPALEIIVWPKGGNEAERLLRDENAQYKIIFNPQWERAAGQFSAAIRQQSADVLTKIHEMSRKSFREAQEVRYKLDDTFRRAVIDQENLYVAPDGTTFTAPFTTNHGYYDRVSGRAIATEREIPSGALPFGFDPMTLIEP